MNETAHIWYAFGIRAKQLLNDLNKVQLDDISTLDFECLQLAAKTAVDKLNEDLAEHLRNHPDE